MLEEYTIIQWLAFFMIYSFFGWCIESTLVSITKRKLVNRGFLNGPILPLYGFGSIVMLLSTLWIKDNILLVFLFGTIAATCLEYFTGATMEAMLHIKYWDYSDKKFNLHGYICLKSSLFWGVLTVFLVEVIQKPISNIVMNIEVSILTITVLIALCIATIDSIDSFRKAFDLQKLLDYQTHIRKEISDITAKLSAAKDNITGSLLDDKTVKEGSGQEEWAKNIEVNMEKLKLDLEMAKEKAVSLMTTVFKRFPSATSKRFNDALQDFKMHFYK